MFAFGIFSLSPTRSVHLPSNKILTKYSFCLVCSPTLLREQSPSQMHKCPDPDNALRGGTQKLRLGTEEDEGDGKEGGRTDKIY
ncbi:hypothetical protein BC936DRAFT_149160 [Jimgerdemannia flammicorona]|uniref:Uncharacterized protein n=1 Tax=Jimgerdemannia flammicorona TaxID=994334 RepID=A0A433D1F0_9FUNG|nr:hypothetical protein BC936DRAFT_149160 [Jimgerdemannia flammicorona]